MGNTKRNNIQKNRKNPPEEKMQNAVEGMDRIGGVDGESERKTGKTEECKRDTKREWSTEEHRRRRAE